ncbi:DUF1796 family putative cysteine peptidase [Peribacillus frigoritolerans]|uniref:DUF1796 family putative cysteine peptidase n=1 Tax=Peribacillus frigoritolerans TaxID=450367 RepID=UPI0023DB96CF|nr:DUF1796 family putative cysteine peptidase [Peribacillus frigoritolerans]MDF1995951.1 DUF1796 family putative cysteine peptidase [Peribacillus frigoritolerans]
MTLDNIMQPYDTIISLGSTCQTAYQIKRKNLRNFSGPIDWMISPYLSDVNRLLKMRFKNFMDFNNLTLQGKLSNITYIVKDNLYNIESYHDFPILLNSENYLSTYSIFKSKLCRRINTFYKMCKNCDSILFVRIGANYDEVVELISILKKIVKKEFTILIINFSTNPEVMEQNWGIDNVSSVEIQDTFPTRWQGCDTSWDKIFKGISLRSSEGF